MTTFENFKYVPGPGGGLVLNWGYTPAHLRVASGSTVAFANVSGKQSGEPHTVSVVAALPGAAHRTRRAHLRRARHGVRRHPRRAQPERRLPTAVHAAGQQGRNGLDQPGDSRLLTPGATAYAKVSAPAGTTLHYICAIHAWMQATITVT